MSDDFMTGHSPCQLKYVDCTEVSSTQPGRPDNREFVVLFPAGARVFLLVQNLHPDIGALFPG